MTYSRDLHNSLFLQLLLLLFTVLNIITFEAEAETLVKKKPSNNSVSAIFVFGDSTVDPGNNNNLNTAFKSNFPPYGETFVNQVPTGRFSDGRLTTDYMASYVGIKEFVPPYLDLTLSMNELMTGVSFASAGSGYDPMTAQLSNVIQMSKQLDYFKEYKTRVEQAIGKQRTQNLINKAAFVVSAGTNDFVVNYFTVPIRRQTFTVSSYQHFVIQQVRNFTQALWAHGARNIAIIGLPPIGCLPLVITFNSDNPFLHRGCIESYCSVARDYNQMLQNELNAMQNSLANRGARIFYIDIYSPIREMIQSGDKFGFEVVNNGCCGTGLLEAAITCNSESLVCPDVSKYVFWDSIHPTDKAYYILFKHFQSTIDFVINN